MTKDLDSVRKFEYRLFRISAGFAVSFVLDNQIFRGLCKDISDTGIRAEFDGPLLPGAEGSLTLHHRTGDSKFDARVAHSRSGEVGIEFVFQAPWQHEMAIQAVAAIVNDPTTFLIV